MDNTTPALQPLVIPRAEHPISRAKISPNALKVLYRLSGAGFRACLVGGGVRDLLLGREPKDFDVGTDAHPEQVYKLFRNCRLIGRRFRLAHVQFGDEIVEVATFRAAQGPAEEEDDDDDDTVEEPGPARSDNIYGTIEEDAQRRDFTINALYYDIETFAVLDYANGMKDLQAGVIRVIGDPESRYREDPVRMLRAVRFAAKLGFRIDPASEAPLARLSDLLEDVPPARLFDEVLKLLQGGYAVQTFELLRLYGLFGHLFPHTERTLRGQSNGFPRMLVKCALANTDARVAAGKSVTPSFLFAALLWEPLRERMRRLEARGMNEREALPLAADSLIQMQNERIALPRRFGMPMREIWALQSRFSKRSGQGVARFLGHERFRAAYDFLLLRAKAVEDVGELAEWWTRIQTLDEQEREQATRGDASKVRKRRQRRPPVDDAPAHIAVREDRQS
ncbi:MAG: polynucleotide adenylyltransferase PcnB [Gammaproteobacteria bacterium]